MGERVDFKVRVLGRVIGTATGWDQHDSSVFEYYGFQPVPEVNIPHGGICIDFDNGLLTMSDDESVEASRDLLPIIANLPQEKDE